MDINKSQCVCAQKSGLGIFCLIQTLRFPPYFQLRDKGEANLVSAFQHAFHSRCLLELARGKFWVELMKYVLLQY